MNKSPFKSKLNTIGVLIAILGVTMTPEFKENIGVFLSPETAARVVSAAGILVVVVRTFFTALQDCYQNDGSNKDG